MKNERTVQKGNVKESSFAIRITEPDGKVYWYQFLKLKDGESVICSLTPFNMKGVENISWEELPFKVKESHYKNLYPNDDLGDYDKKCLLYGKQQADEALAAERKKEEEREAFYSERVCVFPIPSYLAIEVYDKIGPYEEIEIIREENGFLQFTVDNEYIVEARRLSIISIERRDEYDKKRKEWGRRVNQIAKAAEVSFDMATVVANITEFDKAIVILKRINEELNSEPFSSYIKESFWYRDYTTNKMTLKRAIENFLYDRVSEEYIRNLNWSNKFYNAIREILEKK